MLAVRPIEFRELANEVCDLCGVPAVEDQFTYFAADVNEDATKINYIIGVCTIAMKNGVNKICALKEAPEVEDDEAMIIMARAAMNFMYRCDVKKVTISDAYTSEKLIRMLGFTAVDGKYTLDLVEFYKAPCKFTGKE